MLGTRAYTCGPAAASCRGRPTEVIDSCDAVEAVDAQAGDGPTTQAVGGTTGTPGTQGREVDALWAVAPAVTARLAALRSCCVPTKSSRRCVTGVCATLGGGGADVALVAADVLTVAAAAATDVDAGGVKATGCFLILVPFRFFLFRVPLDGSWLASDDAAEDVVAAVMQNEDVRAVRLRTDGSREGG